MSSTHSCSQGKLRLGNVDVIELEIAMRLLFACSLCCMFKEIIVTFVAVVVGGCFKRVLRSFCTKVP